MSYMVSRICFVAIYLERGGVVIRKALIDETGMYRYTLYREWDSRLGRVAFIMLNPSTADGHQDDPTIKRVIGFARSWGYGSTVAVNLFAYRATKPEELKWVRRKTAIGNYNLEHVCTELDKANLIVAAWGENVKIHNRHLDEEVVLICNSYPVKCLGVTREGHPYHPLFRPSNTELIDYVHQFPKRGQIVRMYEADV